MTQQQIWILIAKLAYLVEVIAIGLLFSGAIRNLRLLSWRRSLGRGYSDER
jgi:hypothetical protein